MHSTRQYVGRVLTLLTAKAKRKSWQNGRTPPPPGGSVVCPGNSVDPDRSLLSSAAEPGSNDGRGPGAVGQGDVPCITGHPARTTSTSASGGLESVLVSGCPSPLSTSTIGRVSTPGNDNLLAASTRQAVAVVFSGTRHSRLDGREIGHFRLLGPAPATGSPQQHLFIRLAPAAHHRRHSQAPMPQTSTRSIADPSPHPRLDHWFCEASHARHHSFFRSTDLPGFARASRRLHHFLISPLECWSVVSSTGHGLYHPSLPSSKPTWSGTDKGSTLRLTASSRRPPPLRAPRHYNNPAPTEMGNH